MITRHKWAILQSWAVGLTATAFGQVLSDPCRDRAWPLNVRADADEHGDDLAPGDWARILAAYETTRHAVQVVGSGHYQARNPKQQWSSSFDGRGFSVFPETAGWTWGLQLERYGFAGCEVEVTTPVGTSAEGGRFSYAWNESLEEWFVNDTRGIEHGFTVYKRPMLCEPENLHPLTFRFEVRGPLRPEVNADACGVRFLDESGAIMLAYTGLWVVDASGRELEASFEYLGDRLILSIDEQGARYPLIIDPVVQQQAYLKASNTQAGDVFGWSVSVSGDTVVIGAINEDSWAMGVNGDQHNNLARSSGAAYVFVRSATGWSQQAYLKASNTDAQDFFGTSVSVSGDTMVVGAPLEDSTATGVDGDQNDNSASNSGAAYVFVRNGTSWSQQAYLKARNSGRGDRFGMSVAVSGDTVIVGAPSEDSSATGVNGNGGSNTAVQAGAAYVFARNGTTWSQQAYLKASNSETDDQFGSSVSVCGDSAVVTAQGEDSNATGVNGNQSDNSAIGSGAAYVFVRSGTTWNQQAYLKASNTEAGDFDGMFDAQGVVHMSGNTIAFGAPGEDSNATGVDGDQNDNSASNSGAAYVFARNGTSWSQEAYLKASNTDAGDSFGFSISVSGDTVIVGAPLERSSATGVNGNQNNNSLLSSGAAYMFVRSGATWSQQAYLKASNTDQGDEFGHSVAVSGVTMLVGAYQERSNATGVNGDQNDNGAAGSGAAYVFATSPPAAYCTSKTTSAGCVPFISFSGTPSVSSGSFDILSNDHIEAEPGIYLYSIRKANLDFHGGKLCVKAPFRRLTTLIKVTDGLACMGCAGNCRMFKRDFNQLIQSGADPALTAGRQVFVQVHQRDPNDPTGFGDNLSDGLGFTICP